ncbi:MAG: RHS repeat-associated core domain-containing protein [Desulfobacterales bacterium]
MNASGILVWEAGYMPFGEARVLVSDVENNLRFPGQYFDSETGFHYNWHRYYDPDTGRYLTPDPIGLEGGINLYAYVDGNPVNWADPEGLQPCEAIFGDMEGNGIIGGNPCAGAGGGGGGLIPILYCNDPINVLYR